MFEPLFFIVSTIALLLASGVTWHVFSSDRHVGKLAFGALMLALLTYVSFEFANTLFLVSPTDFPYLEPFASSLTLVLLLMSYSREVLP